MSDIQSYIENFKMKKAAIGGFDKEAVYTSMNELASMYQKDIMKLKEEKEQIEKVHIDTLNELDQVKKEIQLLKFQLEEEKKNKNIYDVRCDALTQAIDTINVSKDKIIEEANKTAEGIIANANEKAERINLECFLQMQQRDLLQSRISDVKQHFRFSMESMRSVLAKMLLEVDDLQKGSLDQMFAQEGIEEKTEISELHSIINKKQNKVVKKMTGSVNEHDSR